MKLLASFFTILVFLTGCSKDSDIDSTTINKPIGYVKIYFDGIEIELKTIDTSTFKYINHDEIGTTQTVRGTRYCSYIDDEQMISKNSLFLNISGDNKLSGIEFYYSPLGTNYSTAYKNYYNTYSNESTPFEYELSEDEKIIEGRFSGILYSGVEKIKIDSCIFRIEKFD